LPELAEIEYSLYDKKVLIDYNNEFYSYFFNNSNVLNNWFSAP